MITDQQTQLSIRKRLNVTISDVSCFLFDFWFWDEKPSGVIFNISLCDWLKKNLQTQTFWIDKDHKQQSEHVIHIHDIWCEIR